MYIVISLICCSTSNLAFNIKLQLTLDTLTFFSNIRVSASEIYHHELVMLFHKVKSNYNTIVRPFEEANTDMNQSIKNKQLEKYNNITITPHLHSIFLSITKL